jgi:hypothetical protein
MFTPEALAVSSFPVGGFAANRRSRHPFSKPAQAHKPRHSCSECWSPIPAIPTF